MAFSPRIEWRGRDEASLVQLVHAGPSETPEEARQDEIGFEASPELEALLRQLADNRRPAHCAYCHGTNAPGHIDPDLDSVTDPQPLGYPAAPISLTAREFRWLRRRLPGLGTTRLRTLLAQLMALATVEQPSHDPPSEDHPPWCHPMRQPEHEEDASQRVVARQHIAYLLRNGGADLRSSWRYWRLNPSQGNETSLRWMLELGADPDEVCDRWETPLLLWLLTDSEMVLRGRAETFIALLLRFGADPNRSHAPPGAFSNRDHHARRPICTPLNWPRALGYSSLVLALSVLFKGGRDHRARVLRMLCAAGASLDMDPPPSPWAPEADVWGRSAVPVLLANPQIEEMPGLMRWLLLGEDAAGMREGGRGTRRGRGAAENASGGRVGADPRSGDERKSADVDPVGGRIGNDAGANDTLPGKNDEKVGRAANAEAWGVGHRLWSTLACCEDARLRRAQLISIQHVRDVPLAWDGDEASQQPPAAPGAPPPPRASCLRIAFDRDLSPRWRPTAFRLVLEAGHPLPAEERQHLIRMIQAFPRPASEAARAELIAWLETRTPELQDELRQRRLAPVFERITRATTGMSFVVAGLCFQAVVPEFRLRIV